MSGYPRWMSENCNPERSYKALWAAVGRSQALETLSSRNRVLCDSANGENGLTPRVQNNPAPIPARACPSRAGVPSTPRRVHPPRARGRAESSQTCERPARPEVGGTG